MTATQLRKRLRDLARDAERTAKATRMLETRCRAVARAEAYRFAAALVEDLEATR